MGRTGAGASDVAVTAPSPVSTTAISAPACTVSPSLARISLRIPVTGAGTSALTLSVSTSSIGSNSTTLSPGFTSHLEIVPSCTDSPSWGITTRVVATTSGTLPTGGEGSGVGRESSVGRQFLQSLRDFLGGRHERLLHGGRVRHRGHIEPTESLHRRVEPAPRLVGDQRHHL